ncbi:uncharacterized membrane protein YcaP (DUF421 family) [Hydrogenoanaerobacterium saccharovorans]|uniref:Uncharacterized membrane protein YcaP, DUF421 family n=1 Tax=Hydrogenoanaerobacterium saccharovorans TaxID=474960 RepID=A0A1H8B3H6_9FIRM|nr:DUF421 domain-containing protein [Hydrogenoanaerobacterium saccharovorans]RPF47632.1 uncharacterized membrane protein YcaP (DUF421 family) [Hydrogenoanaerobacterium saccharovorans]SEM76869.1 Uncharacterized membrane protein YcaP, DUF421 family [Hydrogenoanaerobacterium saccharovorans]
MEWLHVLLSSLGSIIALFILTKIMGNRQMSQLSMFDYINGITIGSIAAEMATSLEDDFIKPLTAMIVYALLSVLFSFATSKSIKLRRILTGETLVLFNEGKIYKSNLKKAKLDVTEFLTQCRNSGYFNLSDIQTAILEPNGKISFLPLAAKRPVTPGDMNLFPLQEKPVVNVILDGKVLQDNLKFTGNNMQWLKKQLEMQKISKIKDVFLATCDYENNLSVYIKIEKPMTRDMFE